MLSVVDMLERNLLVHPLPDNFVELDSQYITSEFGYGDTTQTGDESETDLISDDKISDCIE